MKLQTKRLLKLADHLEAGRPGGHKKFNFQVWHENHGSKNFCGTAGCAVGEIPVIWPRAAGFTWDEYWGGEVVGKGALEGLSGIDFAAEFFGIDDVDSECLFAPDVKRWWSPTILADKATAKQVSKSVRTYIAARQAGKTRPTDFVQYD